jgi:hypothetical protein
MNNYIEYQKLEFIHFAIQEALNKDKENPELHNALGYVEDLREKHFDKKDFIKWLEKNERKYKKLYK